MNKKIKVVTIGGGNGSAVVLVALKQNIELFDVSAVVATSDSGGSSGRLRQELGVLPPGDVLRAILALSEYDYRLLKKIFYSNRFDNVGKLSGHDLGNMFLVLGEKYGGDYLSAIRALQQAVKTQGVVCPASLGSADLCAELSDGTIVQTEEALDHPEYDRKLTTKKLFLKPEVAANPAALKAVLDADYVLFCPGSLVTSVIPTILPQGFKEALEKTKAKLIYLQGGAYPAKGEITPNNLSDLVKMLEEYLPRPLDLVVYNNHKLTKNLVKEKYLEKGWVKYDLDTDHLPKDKTRGEYWEKDHGGLCAIRLGKILKKIIK